jgi:hypothetical protein
MSFYTNKVITQDRDENNKPKVDPINIPKIAILESKIIPNVNRAYRLNKFRLNALLNRIDSDLFDEKNCCVLTDKNSVTQEIEIKDNPYIYGNCRTLKLRRTLYIMFVKNIDKNVRVNRSETCKPGCININHFVITRISSAKIRTATKVKTSARTRARSATSVRRKKISEKKCQNKDEDDDEEDEDDEDGDMDKYYYTNDNSDGDYPLKSYKKKKRVVTYDPEYKKKLRNKNVDNKSQLLENNNDGSVLNLKGFDLNKCCEYYPLCDHHNQSKSYYEIISKFDVNGSYSYLLTNSLFLDNCEIVIDMIRASYSNSLSVTYEKIIMAESIYKVFTEAKNISKRVTTSDILDYLTRTNLLDEHDDCVNITCHELQSRILMHSKTQLGHFIHNCGLEFLKSSDYDLVDENEDFIKKYLLFPTGIIKSIIYTVYSKKFESHSYFKKLKKLINKMRNSLILDHMQKEFRSPLLL